MSLDLPNSTFFIQLALFLFTLYILNRFIFNPLILVIEERRKRGQETSSEAIKITEKTQTLLAEYENKRAGYREQRHQKLEELKTKLYEAQSKQVEAARAEISRNFKKAKDSLAQSIQTAKTALENETISIVKTVTEKFIT